MKTPGREQIAGVILAGGRSQRMEGRDKALLPLGSRPMIARVLDRLAGQVDTIAVNANGDPALFAFLSKPVIADTVPGFAGPLAGVLAGMRWAASQEAGFGSLVTVAADTPFFPPDLVSRLAGLVRQPDTIVVAESAGNRHPVFALWPLALADDLEAWLTGGGTLKVREWMARHDVAVCDFALGEDGSDPFFNINTPDDLAAAEAMLKDRAA